MSKSIDLLPALDEIIPIVAMIQRKYSVTEILEDSRYEFFAVPVTASGFGDSIWRGIERTIKGDWGKARDTYETLGPQVAERLGEVRAALAKGFIEIRKYRVSFEPSTLHVKDHKLKPDAKIMFDIIFAGKSEKETHEASQTTPTSTTSTHQFCSRCGQKLDAEAQYCFKCGSPQGQSG